jgi:hypothetical protein
MRFTLAGIVSKEQEMRRVAQTETPPLVFLFA